MAATVLLLLVAVFSPIQRASASSNHGVPAATEWHRQLADHPKLNLVSPVRALFPDETTMRDFVILFSDNAMRDDALNELQRSGAAITVQSLYTAIAGAHLTLNAGAAQLLCSHHGVVAVEEDRVVSALDHTSDFSLLSQSAPRRQLQDVDERDIVYEGQPDIAAGGSFNSARPKLGEVVGQDTTTQTGAPWAIDRLDQVSRPMDQSYSYSTSGTDIDGVWGTLGNC
jgi:hypothetical protein